jgi:hypothetical protein
MLSTLGHAFGSIDHLDPNLLSSADPSSLSKVNLPLTLTSPRVQMQDREVQSMT